jgi:hypothetical protein
LAIGLILGAFMVIGMLGMLLNKELNLGEFLVWLLAFIGVLACTLASVGTVSFYFLLALTIGLGLIIPLSSWLADRLTVRRMHFEDMERYLRGIAQRPDIPYNYRKLGDLFAEGNDWGMAVAYYEQAEKVNSDQHTKFMLEKARERVALGKGEPRLCRCGRLNPARGSRCIHCGASLPGSAEVLVALGAGSGRLFLTVAAACLLGGGMIMLLGNIGDHDFNVLLVTLGVLAALLQFFVTKAQRQDALLPTFAPLPAKDGEKKPPPPSTDAENGPTP